jgi:hypothetical protein
MHDGKAHPELYARATAAGMRTRLVIDNATKKTYSGFLGVVVVTTGFTAALLKRKR